MVPLTATLGVRVEDLVERVVGVVVQAVSNPGEADVVAEPAEIQVRLAGARTVVTALDPSRLRVWVPPELIQGMTPGEERVVQVLVDGVPAFVTAIPGVERVTVRRTIDVQGPGGLDSERDPP